MKVKGNKREKLAKVLVRVVAIECVVLIAVVLVILGVKNKERLFGKNDEKETNVSNSTEIKEDGVHFSFEAPRTALGDEVLEYLRRGDVNQCSFAFSVDTDEWNKLDDGSYLRTIKKFDKLYDMSIVDTPAYSQTSACARFAEIKEEERIANEKAMKEAEERAAQEAAEAKAKLEEYYNNILAENKDYMPE